MYIVEYKDDYNQKHICNANSINDIKFLQRRFGERNVTFYTANGYKLYPTKSEVNLKY